MPPDRPQRREHILNAAEKLFQHYGFAKTTVADIAQAADVGVGTVYLEFKSKAAIASELSGRRYDCMLGAMRQVAASEGSYAERLKCMFTVKLEWLAQYASAGPHGQELIRGACGATNRAHTGFRAAQEKLLHEFLKEAVAAGEFEIADVTATARVLLGILHALTRPSEGSPEINQVDSVEPPEINQVDSVEQIQADIITFSDLVLRGLQKRNA